MKNGISEISSDSEYGKIITEHALKTVDNFENCKCTNPDCKEFNYLALRLACLLLEKKYGFKASIEKFDTNIGDVNLSPMEIHVEWPKPKSKS